LQPLLLPVEAVKGRTLGAIMPPSAAADDTGYVDRAYAGAMLRTMKRKRGAPTIWRWPSIWAFMLAVVLQVVFGIFPSLFSLVLLVGADPRRCPVAVGGESYRAFYAWALGVGAGILICDSCTTLRSTPLASWVVWGGIPVEIWRIHKGLGRYPGT
jgi:hypothetical protein